MGDSLSHLDDVLVILVGYFTSVVFVVLNCRLYFLRRSRKEQFFFVAHYGHAFARFAVRATKQTPVKKKESTIFQSHKECVILFEICLSVLSLHQMVFQRLVGPFIDITGRETHTIHKFAKKN